QSLSSHKCLPTLGFTPGTLDARDATGVPGRPSPPGRDPPSRVNGRLFTPPRLLLIEARPSTGGLFDARTGNLADRWTSVRRRASAWLEHSGCALQALGAGLQARGFGLQASAFGLQT